jgi:hypothetical protein
MATFVTADCEGASFSFKAFPSCSPFLHLPCTARSRSSGRPGQRRRNPRRLPVRPQSRAPPARPRALAQGGTTTPQTGSKRVESVPARSEAAIRRARATIRSADWTAQPLASIRRVRGLPMPPRRTAARSSPARPASTRSLQRSSTAPQAVTARPGPWIPAVQNGSRPLCLFAPFHPGSGRTPPSPPRGAVNAVEDRRHLRCGLWDIHVPNGHPPLDLRQTGYPPRCGAPPPPLWIQSLFSCGRVSGMSMVRSFWHSA